MKPLHLTAAIALTAAEGTKPRRFDILAYSGGTLVVEGFDSPVVVDLAGLETPNHIPILIDHTKSVDSTLGITDTIHNNGMSLSLGGTVTGQSSVAQQVIAQSVAGQQWQASIGAMVIDSEDIKAGQTVDVNGQTFTGPIIIARRATLRETSVLPMGADPTTTVNLAAFAAGILQGMAAMTFEEWLAKLGVDMTTLAPEDAAALQLAHETMSAPPEDPEAPAPPVAAAVPPAPVPLPTAAPPVAAAGVKDMDIIAQQKVDLQAALAEGRKIQAAEARRVAEIQAKAAGHPMIIAKAIEAGWSIDKVELEVLIEQNKKTRPTSFTAAQNAPEDALKVIEAAICSSRGVTNNGRNAKKTVELDDQFDDKTLQAAHTTYRNGIGLQQILLSAAAAAGMPLSAGMKITSGNMKEVLSYAFPPARDIQAAFSSLSVPGILGNVANKEILQGYMEEDAVWREVGSIKSVSDFKTVTSYTMLDNMKYEELGPGGTIKHGSVDEESYTRQAATYAKMFSITRTDIINDDLNAFDSLREVVGRGGAIKLNDLFWTTWLSNASTIWTSGRTNYISGSTTNLGTDGVGLGLGQKSFRSRTSPSVDGAKRLGGSAKFLLVPPELEVIADQLFVARNDGQVSVSDTNTFATKYRPIVANQLSDTSYTGYSTTAWWLLGEKSKGSAVTVSFLNGQETPTVESADADFNTLGIQFRGYHDFGCDAADYLNSIHSKGAS